MKKTSPVAINESAIYVVVAQLIAPKYRAVSKTNGLEAVNWRVGSYAARAAGCNAPLLPDPETTSSLRPSAQHQGQVLLMLSGEDTASNNIQGLPLGAGNYLAMPVNPKQQQLSLRI